MILIFYALRRELGGLRRRIKDRQPLGEGLRGFRGRIGGEEVALVATGIGVGQARAAARRALAALPAPRLIISTGVAGALAPELKAGDLVIADRLLLEEDAASEPGGSALAVTQSPDTIRLAQAALSRAGLRFVSGPLLTAARVLDSAGAKRDAYRRTGAVAVDMESAAIAIEAAGASAPFICVRAVLDAAHEEVPGAHLPDATGHVPALKAAAFFLGNPSALARVPALLKNLNRASASIAVALTVVCAETGF